METAAKAAGLILGLAILLVLLEAAREAARRRFDIDPVTRLANVLAPPASGGGQS